MIDVPWHLCRRGKPPSGVAEDSRAAFLLHPLAHRVNPACVPQIIMWSIAPSTYPVSASSASRSPPPSHSATSSASGSVQRLVFVDEPAPARRLDGVPALPAEPLGVARQQGRQRRRTQRVERVAPAALDRRQRAVSVGLGQRKQGQPRQAALHHRVAHLALAPVQERDRAALERLQVQAVRAKVVHADSCPTAPVGDRVARRPPLIPPVDRPATPRARRSRTRPPRRGRPSPSTLR